MNKIQLELKSKISFVYKKKWKIVKKKSVSNQTN